MARSIIIAADAAGLRPLENMLAAVGPKAPAAMRRAVNHTGDKAKTQVIRALTKQTGLKRKVIVKAVKVRRANDRDLAYVMTTRGGDISLKYFAAREVRKGVTAAPRGKRQFFGSAFMKSGRKPARFPSAKLGGHVFENVEDGKWGGKIRKLKSGVYIPTEMVTGETAATFRASANAGLQDRLRHELSRILGG